MASTSLLAGIFSNGVYWPHCGIVGSGLKHQDPIHLYIGETRAHSSSRNATGHSSRPRAFDFGAGMKRRTTAASHSGGAASVMCPKIFTPRCAACCTRRHGSASCYSPPGPVAICLVRTNLDAVLDNEFHLSTGIDLDHRINILCHFDVVVRKTAHGIGDT